MATCIIGPNGDRPIIVKCYRCRTLYVPDMKVNQKGQKEYRHPFGREGYFEECPSCGCGCNNWANVIPLWRYNLIKFFRGGFRNEQPDDSGRHD